MTHQTSAAHEGMAAELVASGNYRVLRRFQPLQHYGAPDASAISRGADLSHATMLGADLSGANLKSANLSNADLRHANLHGADVTARQLADAKSIAGATLPDGTKPG